MAKKNRFTEVGKKVGAALGKAQPRSPHQGSQSFGRQQKSRKES